MTAEEQRETALRLYRLAWRTPENAPVPKDASCSGDYGLSGYSSFFATAGAFSVEACVFDSSYARAIVENRDGRRLFIEGPVDHIEAMLRSIPAEMRPQMEALQ